MHAYKHLPNVETRVAAQPRLPEYLLVPGRLEIFLQFDVGQRFDLQLFRQIFRHLQQFAVIQRSPGQRFLE